jgi:hypothetical protein
LGTVLFPRIVVTAAHCVQQKVQFRGGEFHADSYLAPADLTVTVTHHGSSEDHAVADVAASPVWRGLEAESVGQRFAHDLALIVTKEPINVGLPPSFDKLADDETVGPEILSVRPSDTAVAPRYEALRRVLETGLSHRGVLVAFGADKCSSLRQCGNAGIRRYLPISIKASADCFNDSRGRPRWPPLPPEVTAVLPLAVWCGIERHAGRQRRRASGRGRARAALLSRRHLRAAGAVPGNRREHFREAQPSNRPLP